MLEPARSIDRPAGGRSGLGARFERLAGRFGTVGELALLCIDSGRFWLLPLFAILGLTAIVLVAVQVIEYVAPFVYTFF